MATINSILYLLLCGITTIAMLVVLNLLLPGKVERVREKLEGHFIRSFVTGLVGLGFSFAILLLLAYIINLPVFKKTIENMSYVEVGHMLTPGIFTLLLILLALGLTNISAIGLAALANYLGRRVGKVGPSINPNLLGASLLVLSGLTPFLGWFIFTPVAVCLSCGSALLTFFQRKPTPKVSK